MSWLQVVWAVVAHGVGRASSARAGYPARTARPPPLLPATLRTHLCPPPPSCCSSSDSWLAQCDLLLRFEDKGRERAFARYNSERQELCESYCPALLVSEVYCPLDVVAALHCPALLVSEWKAVQQGWCAACRTD